MKTLKRTISIIVYICLVLTILLPGPVLAYDTWGPISDFTTYKADGSVDMTYYDIYSGDTTGRNDLNDQFVFYKDVVTNRDNLLNWSYLGYEILKNGGGEVAYWDHDGYKFDGEFGAGGRYVDLISQWNNPGNLQIANSLSAVESAARARISDYFVTSRGHREVYSSNIPAIQTWQDDTTPQPVFYTGVFCADNDIGQRYYNYFGLAFYDFKLSLLADENLKYSTAADGYATIENAAQAGAPGVTYQQTPGSGNGFVNGISNLSTLPVQATQEVKSETTTTISNSIENSESYSYGEMIGAKFSMGGTLACGLSLALEVYTEFEAEQVYSTAYTSGTQNSKTISNTASQSVLLPPHTQILMKQSDNTVKATLAYDSPVVITYKVAVYSYCGHIYWDGLRTHILYKQNNYLATFGKDNGTGATAVENLANRIKYYPLLPGYETSYGDGLNWNSIYFNNTTPTGPRVKTATDWLISHKPMSVTGATLTFDYEGFSSEIYATQPLYPLKIVSSTVQEIYLGLGQEQYLNIPVSGYDKDPLGTSVPYCGFDSKYGHWILVNSAGTPITVSPTASLSVDITENTILKAGNTPGIVYLKYLIDENRYSYGTGQIYTKNSDLESTAIIKVNVAAGPTTLTVTPVSAPHGGTADLSARLSVTADGTSVMGKTITFSLNGANVGSAITNANGVATLARVALDGNAAGTYPAGIKASFLGDSIYNASTGTAQIQINIASLPPSPPSGQGATGGGWYTLEDRGRVTFSFNVEPIPNPVDHIKYKGELLLINDGRWRLKGAMKYYHYNGNSQGEAVGSGSLYLWNKALNEDKGGWEMVVDNVGFGINFADLDTGNAKDPLSLDKFGLSISVEVPAGAPPLPGSSPAVLEGGNINIKDLHGVNK